MCISTKKTAPKGGTTRSSGEVPDRRMKQGVELWSHHSNEPTSNGRSSAPKCLRLPFPSVKPHTMNSCPEWHELSGGWRSWINLLEDCVTEFGCRHSGNHECLHGSNHLTRLGSQDGASKGPLSRFFDCGFQKTIHLAGGPCPRHGERR